MGSGEQLVCDVGDLALQISVPLGSAQIFASMVPKPAGGSAAATRKSAATFNLLRVSRLISTNGTIKCSGYRFFVSNGSVIGVGSGFVIGFCRTVTL